MNLKSKLSLLFKRDWLVALFILGVYLATNRYIYGWDDQHLEIPLLKHLIDPMLYQGDYYVESLVKNFTSYLYPILARFITVEQIPSAYLFLFLVSRYFLFYWWLKLWALIAVRSQLGTGGDSNSKLVAASAVVYAIVLGRTEEFLYRTFSHQEFSLPIIFAAFYFFYKDRYILAAFLYGLAANFHALYALFPMIYMSVYLLFFHRERKLEYWLKTGCVFAVSCAPFLFWTITKALKAKAGVDPHLFDDWVQLYLLACPQNFPFAVQSVAQVFSDNGVLLKALTPYLILISLFTYNYYANDHFRQDRKAHALAVSAGLLILACFYFAYVVPNRFMLDLNLIRNEQFLRFFLLGYLVISAIRMIQIKDLFWTCLAGLIFVLGCRQDYFGTVPVNLLIALMIALKTTHPQWKTKKFMYLMTAALTALALWQCVNIPWKDFKGDQLNMYLVLISIPIGFVCLVRCLRQPYRFRSIVFLLPILLMIGHYMYYHYQYVQVTTKGGGFWQLQRNWEDMQRYVQKNTPKSSFVMVPYNMEMCGFRIASERKILVSYRDCGIVGFDYGAAKEWQRRIADVNAFKVFTEPQSIGQAIVNALFKYKVDYIVFMRYYAPGDNAVVRKVYENEVFALYQVVAKRE